MKCDSSLNADHLRIPDSRNCLVSLAMGAVRGRVLFGKAGCRFARTTGFFFNNVVPRRFLVVLPTAS